MPSTWMKNLICSEWVSERISAVKEQCNCWKFDVSIEYEVTGINEQLATTKRSEINYEVSSFLACTYGFLFDTGMTTIAIKSITFYSVERGANVPPIQNEPERTNHKKQQKLFCHCFKVSPQVCIMICEVVPVGTINVWMDLKCAFVIYQWRSRNFHEHAFFGFQFQNQPCINNINKSGFELLATFSILCMLFYTHIAHTLHKSIVCLAFCFCKKRNIKKTNRVKWTTCVQGELPI